MYTYSKDVRQSLGPRAQLVCRRLRVGSLLLLLAAGIARAQGGRLVVQVTYLGGKQLDGVRIGAVGSGSLERTAGGGVARIHLASEVKIGQEVELQVVQSAKDKEPWVFISPWNQRIVVPSFDAGRVIPVILARKADKEALLESSDGRKAILQSILSDLRQLKTAEALITTGRRAEVLKQQAAAYGLRPDDVDTAIRAAAEKSPDLYEQGLASLYQENYPLASQQLAQALAASEKELQQAREKVGDRSFFLGGALEGAGRYPEAVASLRKALDVRGEDARTLGRLGQALLDAGEFSEAKAILGRALTAAKLDRAGDKLKLAILDSQALTLTAQGDLAGARRLEEQVLESRRRLFGTEHPDTLLAKESLAETLYAQGDLAEARKLVEQVLEAQRRLLGAEHPDTLVTLGDLAVVLIAQGDSSAARKLEEEVLAASRRLFGVEHPATLKVMGNLAWALALQGDLPEARKLGDEVLTARRRLMGAEHPDTLLAMSNLANMLDAQGDLAGARKLEEEVLEARQRLLGAEHPDTLTAMSSLAAILFHQRDLPGARSLETQVLTARRRLLGAEHPDTLRSMGNLGSTLAAQGDLAGARELQEKVLEARRRRLGPRHPETSTAAWKLLQTRRALGDGRGSRELEKSLDWLLVAEEATLSQGQREIRRNLGKVTH
jgi:tetratricopeptide (TPR) repeat protein